MKYRIRTVHQLLCYHGTAAELVDTYFNWDQCKRHCAALNAAVELGRDDTRLSRHLIIPADEVIELGHLRD